MGVIFGSARIDENGGLTGGAAGDQTGKEVSTQAAYMHSKGWYVLRPTDAVIANGLAIAMLQACNNNNIGYDQSGRAGVITAIKKFGSMDKISTATEADCSSLVRACCIQVGFDPGNFTTANEADKLEATRLFNKRFELKSFDELYDGDVLVTKTKGHTVIVVDGKDRESTLSTAQNMLKQALGIVPGKATLEDANKELQKALGIKNSVSSSTNSSNNTSGSSTPSTPAAGSEKKYVVGTTYTLQADALRVRTGPGTNYSTKRYSQLSENAKKYAYSNGTLKKGTKVTCKAVKNVGKDIWIQTPSGWMAAYYDGKVYIA